jgi:hypothetical protein
MIMIMAPIDMATLTIMLTRQSVHGPPRPPGSPGSAPPRGGDYWTCLQRGGGLNPQNRSPFPGVTSPVPGVGQAPWQTEEPLIC